MNYGNFYCLAIIISTAIVYQCLTSELFELQHMVLSDYFIGKKILQREKEHCAILICAHFMWGLWLRLRLSWDVRVRVGVSVR